MVYFSGSLKTRCVSGKDRQDSPIAVNTCRNRIQGPLSLTGDILSFDPTKAL